MSRFIPLDVQERTLQKNKFFNFLVNEIKSLLLDVRNISVGGALVDEFRV